MNNLSKSGLKRLLVFSLAVLSLLPASAQRVLSLDSCRAMALRNNKQLIISRMSQDVASDVRKAARTNYLPKVDGMGSYQHFGRDISILSGEQQSALSTAGTSLSAVTGQQLTGMITSLVQQGAISPQLAQTLGGMLQNMGGNLAALGNAVGEKVVDAFHTDTRNIFGASVIVRQPLFMGGAIMAANKLADIGEELASNQFELSRQNTLQDIDQTYWLVVSLRQKHQLAKTYSQLIKQFENDVHKMIEQGVATKADGLKVDVRANEADMMLTQAEDGLTLSRMLLCQLCGLDLHDDVVLADEQPSLHTDRYTPAITNIDATDSTYLSLRPELRALQNAVDASKQSTRLVRSAYLPHVLLTGGYMATNPNVYNGFQRRFSGTWNVGVTLQMPLWTWMESTYKIRASRTATQIARMELAEAREKINLQVTQSRFKLSEARKRLNMALGNTASADENLRCANVGFREGVMSTTDVMAAQTAWQQAQAQKIDAEIEVQLAEVALNKALGKL